MHAAITRCCPPWRLTSQVCTLVPCLWIPFPPVYNVCRARSGECGSALSSPPCSHRSASPSVSQSRSDFHFPLIHTDVTQMKRIPIIVPHIPEAVEYNKSLGVTDWHMLLPWTTPQGYWRAFTILLPIQTSSVLPTTANGKWPYKRILQYKRGIYWSS